jgi:transcription initiation factor IIE alpha subunit
MHANGSKTVYMTRSTWTFRPLRELIVRNFMRHFENTEISTKMTTEQREVNDLILELQNLKIYDGRKATDTRATITMKYSDHVEAICADGFSIYKNGTCYQITDKLKKTIW